MRPICLALAMILAACQPTSMEVEPEAPSFAISFSPAASSESLDGRLILMLSRNDEREPRFQVRPGLRAVQMFGINVDGVAPGQQVIIDAAVFGYPYDSLNDLPAGEYFVQALLHRYETF